MDKASLINLLLTMQEQLTAQGVLIQVLRDQLVKDSHNSSKLLTSDGLKKLSHQQFAPTWAATVGRTTRPQG